MKGLHGSAARRLLHGGVPFVRWQAVSGALVAADNANSSTTPCVVKHFRLSSSERPSSPLNMNPFITAPITFLRANCLEVECCTGTSGPTVQG